MVLGLTRSRTRLGGTAARAYDDSMRPRDPIRLWLAERGEILFEASCDVVGGFPGYADRGGRLDNTRLRVSERYLLVGDNDEFGFGLPIREIEGVALVSCLNRDDHGLRVFYRDGVSPRLFTAQFHGNRLSFRSGPRAERAHLSLLRAGLADQFAASPPEPDFLVPWNQTAEIEAENVLWAGRATAPRQIGLESVASNVWLTTRSLIWGCETIAGVHRIPLSLLTDVAAATVADRAETPAVYVGLGDETSGHFDLAFLFDQQSTADHNLRERGAFLVGLRSRGIPVGTPPPPFQPWRHDLRLIYSQSDEIAGDAGEAPVALAPRIVRPVREPRRRLGSFEVVHDVNEPDTEPTESAALAATDLVLAEWASLPGDEPGIRDDVQLSAGWSWREVWHGGRQTHEVGSPSTSPCGESAGDAAEKHKADDVPVVTGEARDDQHLPADAALAESRVSEQPPRVLATSTPWPRASAYESTVVDALAEVLAAIRDRASGSPPAPLDVQIPPTTEQQAAIAELTALCRTGVVADDELRARLARLVALGDACVRLRTLVELRDGGHISDADLARRQRVITAQLATMMDVR